MRWCVISIVFICDNYCNWYCQGKEDHPLEATSDQRYKLSKKYTLEKLEEAKRA